MKHNGNGQEPTWDGYDHTLFWRGQTVKHFQKEAPHQEAILQLCEKLGWPSVIPLAPLLKPSFQTKDQLRDAINNLNRSIWPHLRFRLEGNGSRLRWEER